MHPDGPWFSSATGGLQYTPKHDVPLRDPERFAACCRCDQTDARKREKNTEDTAHCGLPFSFNSFDPSKDFYKVCYVNAIYSPPPNNNTIHEYSCTLLTYPDSREIIMCRVAPRKVNEQAIFHIIVLSVINRNKSMQYSSLAVVFLFRFWHHPWDEVSESVLRSAQVFR